MAVLMLQLEVADNNEHFDSEKFYAGKRLRTTFDVRKLTR